MIHFRKFEKEHIPLKVAWVNDTKNNLYLHYDLPLAIDKTQKWFEMNVDNLKRRDYVIYNEVTPVGLIGLLNIDLIEKVAELYILVHHEFQKLNIGYLSIINLLNLFRYDLYKIYLYTELDNISAQKLFEKVGFEKSKDIKVELYKGKELKRYIYYYIF